MDDFLLRALLGGLGVALVAGPMGSFVVWGRMAFFSAAIAHSALLGVALALLLDLEPTLGVVVVSLAAALALLLLQGQKGLATDTLLSIIAHGALALGLVVAAFMETVRVDLMGYLFGDILAVAGRDILLIWGTAGVGLAVLAWIWRPLLSLIVHEDLAQVEGVEVTRVRFAFMVMIALVIAFAIKVVGLLLITALLVMPAAAARQFARTPLHMATLATAIGCASVVLGLMGSAAWDTPSGPTIVVTAAAAFVLSRLLPGLSVAPRR